MLVCHVADTLSVSWCVKSLHSKQQNLLSRYAEVQIGQQSQWTNWHRSVTLQMAMVDVFFCQASVSDASCQASVSDASRAFIWPLG